MNKFLMGQRYISDTEPELGLGIIKAVANKNLTVFYPATNQTRTYGQNNAPIRRVIFQLGDKLKNLASEVMQVTEVVGSRDEIISYFGDEKCFKESELDSAIHFNRPEARLFNLSFDRSALFGLRYETLQQEQYREQNPLHGFIGCRISLIPHQLYLADKVAKYITPRVLLADEVGLGKTIEAGLIIHKLILDNRVQRVLILVPNSLTYQWFVEMYRKFNLSFSVVNQEEYREQEKNPFYENELVICSIGLLKGSKVALDFINEVSWDLVVVDEAHQLRWSREESSVEYEVVKKISEKSTGLILLTATPEQFGLEGHFARLHLIDARRFDNLDRFLEENKRYQELAQQLPGLSGDLIDDLIDQHGTGRVFFRNSRKTMEGQFGFFPRRILREYALKNRSKQKIETFENDDACSVAFHLKVAWLIDFLKKQSSDKIFLVCRSKKKIIHLDKILKESISNIRVAVFHSELTLMARDRQVAYFADPKGANILLCTEIGSEGRNFEFASNLIMFDLPSNPDLLEQRIGRLDRIGQKKDIYIHVPYVEDSWEEILFSWYRDGLNGFTTTVKGSEQIYSICKDRLVEAYQGNCKTKLSALIDFSRKEYEELKIKLEEGKDVIVELNSFNLQIANELVSKIKELDKSTQLKNFMDKAFQHLGVEEEDLDASSLYIRPGDNMYVPHFPELSHKGLTITYDRSRAQEREDFTFLSWDHPMVSGVTELILSNEFGNVTAVRWKDCKIKKVIIEAIHVFKSLAQKGLPVARFFPFQIIRILVDTDGNDYSTRYSKEEMDEKVLDIPSGNREALEKVALIPREKIIKTLKQTSDIANSLLPKIKEDFRKGVLIFHEKEIGRLRMLVNKNGGGVDYEEEIGKLERQQEELLTILLKSEIYLDSFRLIF